MLMRPGAMTTSSRQFLTVREKCTQSTDPAAALAVAGRVGSPFA
jgi:hypothetical protein